MSLFQKDAEFGSGDLTTANPTILIEFFFVAENRFGVIVWFLSE